MPDSLVHHVERFTSRLFGASTDIEDSEYREICPTMDCASGVVESLWVEHSGISTDILLFSELGLSLTQHYRVYRGGLPHAVFRTDYIERLRALLPPPRRTEEEPASPPETGRGATPRYARRLHRSSRPMRRMSEAVDDGPL